MKIKRYMADSMRTALAQVRADQGPDAVILSTRRIEEGIEVIAAVDYDEALFADATLKRATAPAMDSGYPAMQARILAQFTAMDIAPDVARSLVSRIPNGPDLENWSRAHVALLVRHLPVVEKIGLVNAGVITVVGPTGAGKTTTIAKLAANWTLQHGSHDLALVSTDAHRIGAREQLMTYARIVGAPMHMANNAKELAQVIERLKDKKLILIDTAGMGPKDVRLTEHLAALQTGAARASVFLALPAPSEGQALEEIVRSFAIVSPAACIVTKVDEAASLGAVISTTLRHQLPIAYVSDGQRVPEDLHSAYQRRLWLISTALELKQHPAPRVGDHFARHIGRGQAHA